MLTMLKREGAVYNLGPAAAIPPGEGREYNVAGRGVAVFCGRDGAVYAVDAVCPHRAGPLADGIMGATTIVCPLHAYRFDLASGRPLGNDCTPLRVYRVEVDGAGDLIMDGATSGAAVG